ncbi:MAG: hypothetical protein ACFFEN_10115 [Candidatus Thorarchaeota archaeon]
MTECEYCGQEDAVIEIDHHFFHRECYSNFVKEHKNKNRKIGAVFLLVVISIGLGLVSLIKGFDLVLIASIVLFFIFLFLLWFWRIIPSFHRLLKKLKSKLETDQELN